MAPEFGMRKNLTGLVGGGGRGEATYTTAADTLPEAVTFRFLPGGHRGQGGEGREMDQLGK